MLTNKQLHTVEEGLSFADFIDQWEKKNALPMTGLDPVARRYRFYSKYNIERQRQVEALWRPSAGFRAAVENTPAGIWLFITDDWCVDSAYSLPLIQWGAQQRPDVELRILMKDDQPDIMDLFLTQGKRSIPKWVGLGRGGEVMFSWGPQPDAIRAIRQALMDGGVEGRLVSQTTVEWYANEGWLEVDKELTTILSQI
ncbi:MAG: thioredoxin family protein [Verrucomicrobia bacterium]|nr:thioredoxin family protein [Verrucomicrobiota bacterium]